MTNTEFTRRPDVLESFSRNVKTDNEDLSVAGSPVGSAGVPRSFGQPKSKSKWIPPFSLAVGEHVDAETMAEAVATAADARSTVSKGIRVARNLFPSIIDNLRSYFAVGHLSVRLKILAILVPFVGYKYVWRNKSFSPLRTKRQSWGILNSSPESQRNMSSLYEGSLDINNLRPDLYIPLMSFMTFVFLYGFVQATASQRFNPEILSKQATYFSMFSVLEAFVVYCVFYGLGITYLPFLEILSILSVKYVCFSSTLLIALFSAGNSNLQIGSFVYFSFCGSHATFQWLKESHERNSEDYAEWGRVTKTFWQNKSACISVLVSILQLLLSWIIYPIIRFK